MQKKLITKSDIENMNIVDGTIFYVEKHMILSPGAKDCLRKKEVKLEYITSSLARKGHKMEHNKEASSLEVLENSRELGGMEKLEDLKAMVKKILYEDYQIEDQHIVEIILGKIKK